MASAQSGNPIRPLLDQLYLLQINNSHCLERPLRQLVETNCSNILNEATIMIITFPPPLITTFYEHIETFYLRNTKKTVE